MYSGTKVGLAWSLISRIIFPALLVVPIGNATAESPKSPSSAEPKVRSIYPLGAQPGTSLHAEVLGHDLNGCYAVWVSAEDLSVKIRGIGLRRSRRGPKTMLTGPSRNAPDKGCQSKWKWIQKPRRASATFAW